MTTRTREALIPICEDLKKKGKRLGFTSGVFDLLHPGHVKYLSEAKGNCDVLVVGVNSNSSVKALKGENRPVCLEDDRLKVVAGLRSVGHAFLFSELNNNKNIEILKPDIYFKAGDYAKTDLSSAPLVEAYGGKVILLGFDDGYSTTKIINKITEGTLTGIITSNELPPPKIQPAVFLDRDGTLVQYVEHLHTAEQMELITGVLEALKKLREGGFRLVIITNQPGIGLGYFTKEDFFIVTKKFLSLAAKAGVVIDKIYYCPHHEGHECECRKPKTGLIERAVRELGVDLSRSYIVGDTTLDIQLGKNAGCKTVLVKTGLGGKDGRYEATPDKVVENIVEAGRVILGL